MKDTKTVQHSRDSRGQVQMAPPVQKVKNPVSQFLAFSAMALALTLGITGLLLYASMDYNAKANVRIDELENRAIQATQHQQTAEMKLQEYVDLQTASQINQEIATPTIPSPQPQPAFNVEEPIEHRHGDECLDGVC